MAAADQLVAVCAAYGGGEAPDRSAPACHPPEIHGGVSFEGSWPIRVAIVRARNALISMRLEEASKAISRLNRLLSTCHPSAFLLYSSTLRILRAFRLAIEDDFAGARSALATLPPPAGDSIAATILRYADWRCGESTLYAPDMVNYLAFPAGGKAISGIYNLCVSAALAFDRLHLTVSAALAQEALELARRRWGNHSPLSCLPATLLAQVAYEQGRLDEAEALLRPRLPVIRSSAIPECVLRASMLLTRVSLHRGRHACALASLRETIALARARRWPRLQSLATSEYARAVQAIRYRDERTVDAWKSPNLESTEGAYECPSSLPAYDSPAHQLSGSNLEIRGILARPRTAVVLPTTSPRFSSIETALQRACSVAADGCIDDSYDLLIHCLRAGAAHGLRMVFVDAGPHIFPLLLGLYHAIPANHPQFADLKPYIVTILSVRAEPESEGPAHIAYRSLSRREAAVLQMIARGMSNKCIARSLGITPETVKTHAKSIFSKLDTRTRAQAVARAEAIGLL